MSSMKFNAAWSDDPCIFGVMQKPPQEDSILEKVSSFMFSMSFANASKTFDFDFVSVFRFVSSSLL